jgi:hypothetical protein
VLLNALQTGSIGGGAAAHAPSALTLTNPLFARGRVAVRETTSPRLSKQPHGESLSTSTRSYYAYNSSKRRHNSII